LSRDCRRILASDWYRRIFLTRLSPERQAMAEFETTAQGCRPLGGGLVKAAWFKHYPASALPQHFDRIVQSWDTANKATELSDFSVCTTWGIAGNNLYLIDLVRRRMEYPELKREVRAQYERFRPSIVLIEDKASGTQLIQELVQDGLYAVTRYQPQTDKIMRMHAQTAMIENGFVHLPEAAPWPCGKTVSSCR
jgi:predicted phage terminase large subunit-like protein